MAITNEGYDEEWWEDIVDGFLDKQETLSGEFLDVLYQTLDEETKQSVQESGALSANTWK